MTIIGWKSGADSQKAIQAINKHTGLSLVESKSLINTILNGDPVVLPDDFILREDLEDCKFIIGR